MALIETPELATRLARAIASDISLYNEEKITEGIKSFPKGSAGGASGLRPQHLKDALIPGFADEVVRNVVGVIQVLARGDAPAAIQPYLCGASLAALRSATLASISSPPRSNSTL